MAHISLGDFHPLHIPQGPETHALNPNAVGLGGLADLVGPPEQGRLERLMALPLGYKLLVGAAIVGFGYAGYRRGQSVSRRCKGGEKKACRIVLPTIGWSLLAWPVGWGYLVSRLTSD